jgi:uncharacterized protein (DUF2141 family)
VRLSRAALLAACLGVSVHSAVAADLTVHVRDIRNDHGRVYVTLFDSDATWLDGDKSLQDLSTAAVAGETTMVFHAVPPGRYALVTFHDENNNTALDYNFFDLPTEGYAFSRDARPFFSPPGFERCAFRIATQDAEVAIKMVYP